MFKIAVILEFLLLRQRAKKIYAILIRDRVRSSYRQEPELKNIVGREMLYISTFFSRIWFQPDMSQSYEIVAHFLK
jgi:hypothetical protein